MPSRETLARARTSTEICNACRYCEGFCAVFPAMELHREFSDGTLVHLANLCHDCRGCFYACQYAPPHEFNLNFPRQLAELRVEAYEDHAWPAVLRGLMKGGVLLPAMFTIFALGFLIGVARLASPSRGPGAFYEILPPAVMIGVASLIAVLVLAAFVAGGVGYWRTAGGGVKITLASFGRACRDALTLRNLGGGGDGCNDRGEEFSNARRRFHHALFYGFALCFVSTVVAGVYEHVLGRLAPYPLASLPVVLGTVGGIGICVGAAGLLWARATGDREPASAQMSGSGYALLVQSLLAAVTGLLLLAFRDTATMGAWLVIHLAVVFGLFLTLPYGKFVHGLYRFVALVRNAAEIPR